LRKKRRKKTFLSVSTLSRALPTLPSGRVSQQKSLIDEAVGGVDDPTARWSPLTSTAFSEEKAAQKNFSFC
jgi:hypothetical protein